MILILERRDFEEWFVDSITDETTTLDFNLLFRAYNGRFDILDLFMDAEAAVLVLPTECFVAKSRHSTGGERFPREELMVWLDKVCPAAPRFTMKNEINDNEQE